MIKKQPTSTRLWIAFLKNCLNARNLHPSIIKTVFLSFPFSFFCFASFDLKASDSHLKDNDELDQKPPNAPSKILQASKETLKFYVGNSTQPDSMKNKVVNTGRYAALHFVAFDLLSTGDSPIASISNGARFFLMGQAIHQLGYLASQETDQEKKDNFT